MRIIGTDGPGRDRSRACHFLAKVALCAAASAAIAQDVLPLTKPEVEALAVGKKFQYVRASDGSTVTFDVRDDGRAYYSPTRTSRNLTIQGAYTIGDDGTLCFKWDADKYVSLQDGCFIFKRAGDKTQVYASRNRDRPIGDVVQ
jgi:Protein of unknown function (DUF995)